MLQRDNEDRELHPIQYFSRKTSPAEEKYHSYELEVLAVIEALKKWRVYLIGKHFTIVTDCSAFTKTLDKKEVPLRVSRWAMYFQDFDFKIEHRPGFRRRQVDALSRVHCLLIEDTFRHKLKEAQNNDSWIRAVKAVLKNEDYEDFFLKGDILHKDCDKQLIVVPSQMEEEIITVAHKQGHFSVKKTQALVERDYFIPNLTSKVESVVKGCVQCLVVSSKSGIKEGFLNPIGKADRPLLTYHLDHVGPLEVTQKRYNHILVIVDAFSKFVWLYPTKSTNAEAVVDILKRQSSVFGNPERVITDRGTAFTANLFKEYCIENGIQNLLIATGVPRGNGQVERIHKIVIPMLSKLCQEKPGLWYKHVDRVQQIINNTPPRSTKYSPFRILTGLEMRIPQNLDLNRVLNEELIRELDFERDDIRQKAKENIQKIQEENRKTFNAKRKEEEVYEIGDLVGIKRTQYGVGLKLRPKFFGPYKVVRVFAHGRYEVEKLGDHEGPGLTTTVAEYMKRWSV